MGAQWLTDAVATFGATCKSKLAGPGEEEAAIRAPLENLLAAAGAELGLTVVPHDEVHDTDRGVRPDYAISVAGAITGYYVDRGLDHGAFIPLMAMYPAADVPVVQLSMPSLDPEALLRLGQRLRALRDEGILVIGSGFMTHSFSVMRDPDLARYNASFDEWVADAVSRGDVDSLVDYRAKGPGAAVAHPTADHFVPLLLTMGASDDPRTATSPINRLWCGNSIRSMQVA